MDDGGASEQFRALVQEDGSIVVPGRAVARFGLVPGEVVDLTPGAHGRLVLSKVGGIDTGKFERWRGVVDLGGMSVDEYMLWLRGVPAE